MELDFVKMEGLGNDFIIIDDRDGAICNKIEYGRLAQTLCSRHFSIGADGIILILDSETMDIKFRIFNSNGTEAQMCGNGIRCFAKYLVERKIISKKIFNIETMSGTIISEIVNGSSGEVRSVKVDMGEPVLCPLKIPFKSVKDRVVNEPVMINGKKIHLTAVSMGNPHAVIFVNNVEEINLEKTGGEIETHSMFPEKTNVEFIQVINKNELKMRVWERGAGETLACGTGSCAAVVAAHLNKKTSTMVLVHLKGGDLQIEWDKISNHIYMTGPAKFVFKGRIII